MRQKNFILFILSIVLLLSAFDNLVMANEYKNIPKALQELEAQSNGNLKDDDEIQIYIRLKESEFKEEKEFDLSTEEGKLSQINYSTPITDKAIAEFTYKYNDFKVDQTINLLSVAIEATCSYKTAKEIAKSEIIEYVSIMVKHDFPNRRRVARMVTSAELVGAVRAHKKFKGDGQIIAIIDTGIYSSHSAFQPPADFEGKLTEEKLNDLFKLHPGLTKGKYLNKKIPFEYDYGNKKSDIIGGPTKSHGQHIAGTIGAFEQNLSNGDKFVGIAPNAQLLNMKVDGPNGIAETVKPIEDAVILGASSVNYSIGAPTGNVSESNKRYGEVLKKAAQAGCIVSMAAGNDGYVGWHDKKLPSSENPDYGVVDDPAVSTLGFAVGSVDNTSVHDKHISYNLNGKKINIRYKDYYDIIGVTAPITNNKTFYNKDLDVVDCKKAAEDDIKGKVEGKIALIEYSETKVAGGIPNFNFTFETIDLLKDEGAVGIIMYNNSVDKFFKPNSIIDSKIPIAIISKKDAEDLKKQINNIKVNVSTEIIKFILNDLGEVDSISDFSAWGISDEFTLKPEIVAPGGHIYSTILGSNAYGDMSGTSMATPHVTGGIALLRQRIDQEFSELNGSEKQELMKAILMSTAKPIMLGEPYYSYASVRQQGAGLMKVDNAIDTKSILVAPNTRYSALNLGILKSDKFTLSFEIENISKETAEYNSYEYQVNTDLTENQKFQMKPKNIITTTGNYEPFSIEPGKKKKIDIEVDISDKSPELIKEMPNGFFVEGFVIVSANYPEPDISIPFVGFRPKENSDFQSLPVLEDFIYDIVKEGSKLPEWYSPDSQVENYTHFKTNRKGDYRLEVAGKKLEFNKANPEFNLPIVVSPNDDGNNDFLQFYGLFIRNFKGGQLSLHEYNEDGSTGNEIRKIGKGFVDENGNELSGYKTYMSVGKGIFEKELSESIPDWIYNAKNENNKIDSDKKYVLRFSVKPQGNNAQAQNYDTVIQIDTKAPIVEEATIQDNKLSGKIYDDSGILQAEIIYTKDRMTENKKFYVDSDGTFNVQLPDGIALNSILIKFVDKGYNEFRDSIENLISKSPSGSLTVKKYFEGNDSDVNIEFSIFKDGTETRMVNPNKLPYGSYVLKVSKVDLGYKVANETIPFNVSANNPNPTVNINILKQDGQKVEIKLNSRFSDKDYKFEDHPFRVFAVSRNSGEKIELILNPKAIGKVFEAFIPYGDVYDLKAEGLPQNFKKDEFSDPVSYIAKFSPDSITDRKNSYRTVEIIKGEQFKIIPKTIVEDHMDIKVKYEFKDINSYKIYTEESTLPTSEFTKIYEVYPINVPKGYYIEPSSTKVELSKKNPVQSPEFRLKKQTSETLGSITVGQGPNDIGDVKYEAVSFNNQKLIYSQEIFRTLPFGKYIVRPIEGTYNKNYEYKEAEVTIDNNNKNITANVIWEKLDNNKNSILNISFDNEAKINKEITLKFIRDGETKKSISVNPSNTHDIKINDIGLGNYKIEIDGLDSEIKFTPNDVTIKDVGVNKANSLKIKFNKIDNRKEIFEVEKLAPIEDVKPNTKFSDLNLPKQVTVYTNSEKTESVKVGVNWTSAEYKGEAGESTTFEGTLITDNTNLRNPSNLKASITVKVKSDKKITIKSIKPIDDIKLFKGEKIDAKLPTSVILVDDHGREHQVSVVWSLKDFNPNNIGTSDINGILHKTDDFTIPQELEVKVKVVVIENPPVMPQDKIVNVIFEFEKNKVFEENITFKIGDKVSDEELFKRSKSALLKEYDGVLVPIKSYVIDKNTDTIIVELYKHKERKEEFILNPSDSSNVSMISIKPDKIKDKSSDIEEYKMEVRLKLGSKEMIRIINSLKINIKLDVEPFIYNNRIMLPIRFAAEALGFEVEWNQENKIVILKDKNNRLEIHTDSNKIIVNGEVFESDIKPLIKNDRTFVSISAIARALGLKEGEDIIWDNDNKEATIKRIIKL